MCLLFLRGENSSISLLFFQVQVQLVYKAEPCAAVEVVCTGRLIIMMMMGAMMILHFVKNV